MDGTAVPPPAVHSTPQPVTPLRHLSRFRPSFGAPNRSQIQGAKTLHPLPRPADGVVICGTLWERPAGTQTHSRRTGRKLGQLRCTRQGLVRVSESNTKYGGQRGKTGGSAEPVMGSSISESSGIPKRKKSLFWRGRGLRPAVYRQVFIRWPGLHFGDSRQPTDISGLAYRRAGVSGGISGQGAADSLMRRGDGGPHPTNAAHPAQMARDAPLFSSRISMRLTGRGCRSPSKPRWVPDPGS
jgi:hypothetical protein